ncbi:uncharacterized protein LOC115624843 [Scaptodrosophila lebanonensis]|uniref:Uncharacterized protein LOC115624843 n=1 Tax=Drosophila lebanonensis TaxID=7225 RepID=A0A6J2TFN4_DROLE|nr:uncharacterized protein LOC115624843 [Scaptodrosophila lebanonensis]
MANNNNNRARLLPLLVVLLALTSMVDAMPQRRLKSQRQVELSTPYPAAGFRPKIAFELPGERQPKVNPIEAEVEPLTTTTSQPTTPSIVEDFGLSITEVENQDKEVSLRTPANTYGAPQQPKPEQPNSVEDVDTIEVVAQAPSKEFQPPTQDAIDDFAALPAAANGADELQPVADLPAADAAATPSLTPSRGSELDLQAEVTPNELELNGNAGITPASTYGAPATNAKAQSRPASTYGAPELTPATESDVEEPESELEASQVELVSELEESALGEGLTSGRLILLPLDAAGGQFGRLVLAVPQMQWQRSGRIRSERLRRI